MCPHYLCLQINPHTVFASQFLPAEFRAWPEGSTPPVPLPVGAPALCPCRRVCPGLQTPPYTQQEHTQLVLHPKRRTLGAMPIITCLAGERGLAPPPGPAGKEQLALTLAKVKHSKSDSNRSTSELPAFRRTPPNFQHKVFNLRLVCHPPLPFQATALVLHLLPRRSGAAFPCPWLKGRATTCDYQRARRQQQGPESSVSSSAESSPRAPAIFLQAARCSGAASITAPCARTCIKSQHKIPCEPLAKSSAGRPATPPALTDLRGHPLTGNSTEERRQDEQEQLHPSLSRRCGRQVERCWAAGGREEEARGRGRSRSSAPSCERTAAPTAPRLVGAGAGDAARPHCWQGVSCTDPRVPGGWVQGAGRRVQGEAGRRGRQGAGAARAHLQLFAA